VDQFVKALKKEQDMRHFQAKRNDHKFGTLNAPTLHIDQNKPIFVSALPKKDNRPSIGSPAKGPRKNTFHIYASRLQAIFAPRREQICPK
jgi:hypothetical protein